MPRLLVVRRICTLLMPAAMAVAVGVATPLFTANVLNCFAEDTVPVSESGVTACSEGGCDDGDGWCDFLPICGVNVCGSDGGWWAAACELFNCRSTASVIDDSCNYKN